ncbi:acyltransferase family protein [Shewanella marisflavi]|uniref:acyltransferase family protein n=1 Tax=Shewanella marisflavi TaxID=260364 RepID=UPI003AAE5DED
MKKNSFYDISILGFCGICLVVLGHSLPSRFVYDEQYLTVLNTIISVIYIFHMPLFFYISGYLTKYSSKSSLLCEFKSKAKRLLLPYLMFSIIGYIVKWPLSEFAGRPVDFSSFDFVFRLLYPWENPVIFFWFLPTLFIVSIVFYLFVFFLRYLLIKLNFEGRGYETAFFAFVFAALLLVIIFTSGFSYRSFEPEFLNLTGVAYHLPFFILGYLIALINRAQLIYLLLVFLFVFLFFKMLFFNDIIRLEAAVYLLSFHVLAKLVSQSSMGNSQVVLYGYSNNMTIYLLSFFFQVPMGFIVYQFSNSPLQMIFWSFVIGFLGPVVFKLALNRHVFGQRLIKFVGM